MKSNTYKVTLTGETPFLMHQDNLVFAEKIKAWMKDPANKSKSTAGDDRTPPFTWIGYLYQESGRVVIPSDNLMTVLREGGAKCPTGQRGATFKRQTQSGLVVDQSAWPLTVGGELIPTKDINALMTEEQFDKHEALAQRHHFQLFVKRAKIGTNKHVRVRPRFDRWESEGSITVFDDTITKDVLQNILTHAGAFAGLGDWRPSSPKSPGPFGKFIAKVSEI